MMEPVTKTMMPPEMEGWKSMVPAVTLHWAKGSCVSLAPMAWEPWNFCPSNVSSDASW